MKKTKLTALLSLILCATLLLSACRDGGGDLHNVFDMEKYVYVDDGPAFTKSEPLSAYTDWAASPVVGNVLKFTKDDNTVLYDIEAASSIYNLTATATLEIDTIGGKVIGESALIIWVVTAETVEEKTVYKTTLYNKKGEVLATAARKAIPTFNVDLMLFDEACYRISENGSITKLFACNALSDMPMNKFDAYNDMYYYDCDRGMQGLQISVYDKNLELVNVYTAPSYADVSFTILYNGNLLIQENVLQPEDSDEYTYIDGTDKYLMTSRIYDVEDGESKKITLTYVLADGLARGLKFAIGHDPMEYFAEDYENVIWAYDIEKERVDTANAAERVYAVDQNGEIDEKLNIFGDAPSANLPQIVAPDRYMVENGLGQKTLYNKNGEILGDVTNAVFYESYMVAGGKIYDYNMKLVYDYAVDEMVALHFYDQCVLFEKEGETYLYANGVMNKLIDAENTAVKSVVFKTQFFAIVDSTSPLDVSYTYYNEKGETFTTTSQMLFDEIAMGDTCMIVSGVNRNGNTVYYRFG